MVHAVPHVGSRIQSLATPAKAAPKTVAPTFASSLKSLFGTPSTTSTPAITTTTPASPAGKTPETVAAPPADTSLKALFGHPEPVVTTTTTPAPQAPTAQSVFGPNPWMTAPVGVAPNGTTYSYNPIFFATQATAQKVAQMVGGTVIQSNELTPNGGGFQQQQLNWIVQLPNGNKINPGLVASFYTHGYPQSYIDGLIAGAVDNS
jgi:hypothetical protein